MKSDFKTRRCPISKTEKRQGGKRPAQKYPPGKGQNLWNSGPTPVALSGCGAKAHPLAARPNPSLVPWFAIGGTWDLDPDGLPLRVFLDQTGPPPPLEWLPFPPLVTAVLITMKGAESPGSGRIGVMGAFVFFHLRPSRINFTLPGRPSSALRP